MAETRFTTLFKAKVKEVVDNRSDSLANGDAADYSKYRESVGYLRGLADAIKICEEIEGEFDR